MADEKEIEVLGLNIKIGGREIKLSKNEAKKLHEALDDIFAKEIVKEHVHHYDRWLTYPSQWIYSSGGTDAPQPLTTYCASEANNEDYSLNMLGDNGHIDSGFANLEIK